jgi:hypothetical protein
MRFRNVVNRLTGLGDCQIRDITITEANGDAQATSLAFTVAYDRPSLITVSGTSVDGTTAITTTALAVKDAVARGVRDVTVANTRVYDGTNAQDTQMTLTVTTTGATATQTYGTVAVTLIDETTLFD